NAARGALRRRRRRAAARGRRAGGAARALRALRGRLRVRPVAALRRGEALGADRLVAVAHLEVLDEVVEGRLLRLRLEQVADRVGRLGERLLGRRRDLRDLEDVVAELRLDRALELALLGAEDRRVEGLLLGPPRHARQLAALRLGGRVDRVLLHHVLEGRALLELGDCLIRIVDLLGEDDLAVAA